MFPTRRITLGGDKFSDEYSLAFDGSDDYIDASNNSSVQVGTSDFSICAWIKKAADGSDANIISYGIQDSGGNTRWYFRTDGSNKLEMYSYDGTGTSLISSSTITGTEWNHVALSWDRDSATGAKIYINGVLDAERDGTPEQGTLNNSAQGILIGARRTTGTTISQYWNGKISDIALYTGIALTSSQIKTIYNGREPYNHKEGVGSGNLTGWWRMGDGALDDRNGLIADQTNATITNHYTTDFSASTGWNGSYSVSGGQLTKSSTGLVYRTDISLSAGDIIKFTVDTESISGSGLKAYVGGVAKTIPSTGVSVIYINTTAATQFIGFNSGSGSVFNSLRIDKVNGNAGAMINMASDDFTGDTP